MRVIAVKPLHEIRQEESLEKELKSTIGRLEEDNAQLVYDGMMKELKIEQIENEQAGLIYELMQKGVL